MANAHIKKQNLQSVLWIRNDFSDPEPTFLMVSGPDPFFGFYVNFFLIFFNINFTFVFPFCNCVRLHITTRLKLLKALSSEMDPAEIRLIR